jgi:hypothetical protein
MADPRETARAWLAERVHDAACDCPPGWPGRPGHADYYRSVVDEHFLSTPGVEVDTEYGVQIDGEHSSWYIPMTSAEAAHREVKFAADRGFTAGRTAVERVVIRLPAQPIGETP